MRAAPQDAEAQLRGCRFIVLKGWQNEEYQRHLVEVGAPALVAQALRGHPGHEELAAAACGAVFVLGLAGREAQDGLAGLGVCEGVVQVRWDTSVESFLCNSFLRSNQPPKTESINQ